MLQVQSNQKPTFELNAEGGSYMVLLRLIKGLHRDFFHFAAILYYFGKLQFQNVLDIEKQTIFWDYTIIHGGCMDRLSI